MATDTRETTRLTADMVAFAERDGVLHVLLIRRGWAPFQGFWALPGGHVDAGERVEQTARRELWEETSIEAGPLTPVGVYTAPGRDPRGRYVTAVFSTQLDDMPTPVAADDADAALWVTVTKVLAGPLAFDHRQILTDAIRLRNHPDS
jgi:8-oxo-dGTP diphosphatase